MVRDPSLNLENTLDRQHLVRRLKAIFAADVAGQSCLAGTDEDDTQADLLVEGQPPGWQPATRSPSRPLGSRFLTI